MIQCGANRPCSRRNHLPIGAYFSLVGMVYLNGLPPAAALDGFSGNAGMALGQSAGAAALRSTSYGGYGSVLESRLLAQNNTGAGIGSGRSGISPVAIPSTTILPTDVLPLPQIQNRLSFAENLQLRLLQRLPARFYFTSTTEISLRYESNPFQFPTKRRFIRELGPAFTQFNQLSPTSQKDVLHSLALPGAEQTIFRVLPNVTGGFTLTPRTRLFCNYFMIRDSLTSSTKLNTTINSIAYGLQQDIPIGSRGNIQAEVQFRELYQAHQPALFDYLPGLTFSYVLTPRTVGFVNALMQMRGIRYFQAPTRELDPFYTWGLLHQRGGWAFSASTTLVQNFRERFPNAQIKQDSYSFISDFEIARRLFRQLPGVQAFVRAEPIWNFHSRYTPGLAGMDFRLFYGLRMAVTKPSLTAGLDQLRQQIEEQEGEPNKPTAPRPSAYLMPYQVIASTQQPIHGFIQNTMATNHQPIHVFIGTSKEEVAALPFAASTKTTNLPSIFQNRISENAAPTNQSRTEVHNPPQSQPSSHSRIGEITRKLVGNRNGGAKRIAQTETTGQQLDVEIREKQSETEPVSFLNSGESRAYADSSRPVVLMRM